MYILLVKKRAPVVSEKTNNHTPLYTVSKFTASKDMYWKFALSRYVKEQGGQQMYTTDLLSIIRYELIAKVLS